MKIPGDPNLPPGVSQSDCEGEYCYVCRSDECECSGGPVSRAEAIEMDKADRDD